MQEDLCHELSFAFALSSRKEVRHHHLLVIENREFVSTYESLCVMQQYPLTFQIQISIQYFILP